MAVTAEPGSLVKIQRLKSGFLSVIDCWLGSAASICIGEYFDPKGAGLFCGPFLRKGKVSAYVGSIQSLKDLKASRWVLVALERERERERERK